MSIDTKELAQTLFQLDICEHHHIYLDDYEEGTKEHHLGSQYEELLQKANEKYPGWSIIFSEDADRHVFTPTTPTEYDNEAIGKNLAQ